MKQQARYANLKSFIYEYCNLFYNCVHQCVLTHTSQHSCHQVYEDEGFTGELHMLYVFSCCDKVYC